MHGKVYKQLYDYHNTIGSERMPKNDILIGEPHRIEELFPTYKCLRCGNTWHPRTQNPKQCPKCKSPYWNKPRKEEP